MRARPLANAVSYAACSKASSASRVVCLALSKFATIALTCGNGFSGGDKCKFVVGWPFASEANTKPSNVRAIWNGTQERPPKTTTLNQEQHCDCSWAKRSHVLARMLWQLARCLPMNPNAALAAGPLLRQNDQINMEGAGSRDLSARLATPKSSARFRPFRQHERVEPVEIDFVRTRACVVLWS